MLCRGMPTAEPVSLRGALRCCRSLLMALRQLTACAMASLLPTAAAKGFAAPKSLWTARCLPCVVLRAAIQPQSAYRATVAARSFAYDAATAPTAAGAAEIGEVDFEPAAANTGGCSSS